MGMTVTVTEFPMSGMVDSGCVKKGEEPTTLQRALWGFFKLIHAVIMHQEYAITPVTHFAYHILELAAFMSGIQSGIESFCISLNTLHLLKIAYRLFIWSMILRPDCYFKHFKIPFGR